MCVFSYADGNVQTRCSKDFPAVTVEAMTEPDVARVILEQIAMCEMQVLDSFVEAYSAVGLKLRAIHGILPVTHPA